MDYSLEQLIDGAKKLPLVPLEAATEYNQKSELMISFVDESLSSEREVNRLIGYNPIQVMLDNHKHHCAFMGTIFILGNYELLARTTPWVYRAYANHKFSYDYFKVELTAWIEAINKFMKSELTVEIIKVYEWMLNTHENVIELSKADFEIPVEINEDWLEIKNNFEVAALVGDYKKCMTLADEHVKSPSGMEQFYLQVIQPTMYDIGMLWEKGTVSVAEEHLVSAIAGRVMSAITLKMSSSSHKKGKAIATACPNEFHEIGAWIISDILEQDGWDMRYLGANTPLNDLIDYIKDFKPLLIIISVTMPFNILKAKEIIEKIKSDQDMKNIKIMVGGRPFNDTKGLWESTGADGFAPNAEEAKKIAADWIIDE